MELFTMALMTAGPLAGQISGKLSSQVFSHGAAGPTVRNNPARVKTHSNNQLLFRANLAKVSQEWQSLTDAQRAAWSKFAKANPTTNRLGRSYTPTGHQKYSELNVRLNAFGLSSNVDPPVNPCPQALTSLSLTTDIGAGTFSIVFTPTPINAWEVIIVEAAIFPRQGISNPAKHMRITHFTGTAATSPNNIETSMIVEFGTLQVGQLVFVRCARACVLTGLISRPLQAQGVIVST